MRSARGASGRMGGRQRWLNGVSAAALMVPVFLTGHADAVEFNVGEVSGSFDTTLTLGALFRVQDPDSDLIGRANGGTGYSVNSDDGNLNYDKGLASLAGRATHELSLNYENFGAFVRATYFYDWINAEQSSSRGARTNRTPLSDEAVEAVGRDFDLLDAYVYGGFDVADRPVDIRLGNQVLNWGESTFITNGINVVNPVDVGALRVPGSELRDALVPVPMINASVGLTPDLSVEGFYQFKWEPTEIEPAGTLFSTNDSVSPGGQYVFLGFGAVPDTSNGVVSPNIGARVPRSPDREPDDQGQFGIAARYFASELNDTEFGAYFINHHSRVPISSATTGSAAALINGLVTNGENNYAASSRYYAEYPEDIQVLGLSFNTSVSGISLQGEYSLRKDQPLQIDDVELLQAAFAPAAVQATFAQAFATALAMNGGNVAAATAVAATQANGAAAAYNTNQVLRDLGQTINAGNVSSFFNQDIAGYRRYDVSQAQVTATKAFPPALGANQWILVGEVGANYVHGLPNSDVLRFEGPGTFRGGNPVLAGAEGVQPGGFATKSSWGYRVRARFDYLNAIGPINLFPVVSWAHDVNGTTPLPLGTFLEDRKAISLGLQATYLGAWQAEVQWTSYFGGGDFNLIHDRDFVSMNVKYSF